MVSITYFNRLGFWLIFFFILFLACVEEIDLLGKKDIENRIGISARMVYNDYGEVKAELSAFTSNDRFLNYNDAVNFAEVAIENSKNQRWQLQRAGNGYFTSTRLIENSAFDLDKNLSYRIVCKTESGHTIYSDYEQVLEGTPVTDVTYYETRDTEDIMTNLKIQVNLEKDSIKSHTRVYAAELYQLRNTGSTTDGLKDLCYDKFELYKDDIILLNKNFPEEDLKDIVPYDRPVFHQFKSIGYYTEISTESLSDEAYQYWKNLQQLVERTGDMFDPTPGTLQSNLYADPDYDSTPFGYFYLTEKKSRYNYYSPFQINPNAFDKRNFELICHFLDDGRIPKYRCHDCSAAPFSFVKPKD